MIKSGSDLGGLFEAGAEKQSKAKAKQEARIPIPRQRGRRGSFWSMVSPLALSSLYFSFIQRRLAYKTRTQRQLNDQFHSSLPPPHFIGV